MWTRTETGWEAALPQPFPDEATLQSLIMETPQLLPLEGSPQSRRSGVQRAARR